MATIPLAIANIEEVNYFISYLVAHIEEYGLKELTNGYMGNIPSINNAHPLAMEYGNMLNSDDQGNYTSILPAIGVELINDNESSQQFLGGGEKWEEITQAKIDSWTAIEMKNRFLNGIILSAANLASITAMKVAKGTEKLWGKRSTYLHNVQVAVSVWSDHFEITRILYTVVRDLLNRIKKDISKLGVKNLKIEGQGSIYNFEFHQTLFGAEFTLSFVNAVNQIEIDDSIGVIKSVEESYISPHVTSKPTFKGLGE